MAPRMIPRTLAPVLLERTRAYPVVTLTGPRQSGKTTLCRIVFPDRAYANLERPDVRRFALDDPLGFLRQFPDGAVIDEVQRAPELLSYIQTTVDEDDRKGLFVLTGSQQLDLSAKVTQSLAGRTTLLRLLPLSLEELAPTPWFPRCLDRALYAGFYPRIHRDALDPTTALGDYFETYVERDLRQIVNIRDLHLFQRFVGLCAGRVGQLLNLDGLAADAGVSRTTARAWIAALEASYIVFLLPPYHPNVSKRLVKRPKLYFYDVGLASFLLGIESEAQLARDPLRGSLFENLVVAEAVKHRLHRGRRVNLSFYRDRKGNEVDLVVTVGRIPFPVEVKAGQTVNPDFFRGLRAFERTMGALPLGGAVVYGGEEARVQEGWKVIPWRDIPSLLGDLAPDPKPGADTRAGGGPGRADTRDRMA